MGRPERTEKRQEKVTIYFDKRAFEEQEKEEKELEEKQKNKEEAVKAAVAFIAFFVDFHELFSSKMRRKRYTTTPWIHDTMTP